MVTHHRDIILITQTPFLLECALKICVRNTKANSSPSASIVYQEYKDSELKKVTELVPIIYKQLGVIAILKESQHSDNASPIVGNLNKMEK
jgi:citrate lyase synthetase